MSIKESIRKSIGNVYKTVTLHWLYPARYRGCAKKETDRKKVVFLEVRMPQLTDNFRAIYEELKEQGTYDLHVCSLGEGIGSRLRVIRNSLKAIRMIADAGCVFINDSSYLIGCLPIREETTVIQTWHACGAFKRFGYSLADKKFGTGTEALERYPLHRNFTYVTVSSPEVVWAYAEAFHMEDQMERILPIGISRTDCFYKEERIREAEDRVMDMLTEHGIRGEGKKIVLYAPTFRGKVAQAVSPDVLDFERMHQELGNDWIFLCKHHPFVKHRPQLPAESRGYALDVTEELEIEDLLMVSDVCISDYSSLIFEYSLLERPILFLAHDLEDYYDWRGFYYPFEEMAPGPVATNTGEVVEYLLHLERRFDRRKVARFREKFMSSCDGHATERLLQLLEKVTAEKNGTDPETV